MIQCWRLVIAVVLLAARSTLAVDVNGVVTQYEMPKPDVGSCRLKGIDSSSDNFKYYASVSAQNVKSMNNGCARCIKVTKDGGASVNAYVLDVCQGCNDGEIKLSKTALSELSINPNSNNATVTYKYINCPSNFVKGNVKACLMEGASNSYIPLQFYNTQKVLSKVQINGNDVKQDKYSFFYYATPQQGNSPGSTWYKDVRVTLTSYDNETLSGSFSFDGTTGCASSAVQFSAASTADGEDDEDSSTSDTGNKNSVIIPAALGGVGGLIVIVGSIFIIRRRRRTPQDLNADDIDNQFLSPKSKPPSDPAMEYYHRDSSDGPTDGEASSPAAVYSHAVSPTVAAPSSVPRPAPRPTSETPIFQQQPQRYTAPSYSNSKPPSPVGRPQNSLNTLTRDLPVIHSAPSSVHDESDEEGDYSGSFDVDRLRHVEQNRPQHVAKNDFSSDTEVVVTSPQSYQRAMSRLG
ncbi:hypothetical protein Poli38472_009807 [Pythium oligandrum]|uniref:Expansin-like EG45 domain-containing protein n=1 Tax=Pythium oligandrum TaxID=41045 RepID=A0A8K1CFX9_PYTOL|nr:hypothetical protein Poli38472_009807 [Pythium oligandrum]|eukprot:TMW62314.1 hypothetical protein Poli38472_009807 [Pythium oligandrum]